jgi:hypothetical protein
VRTEPLGVVSKKSLLHIVLTSPSATSCKPNLQSWHAPWIRPLASLWPSSTSTLQRRVTRAP